MRNTVSALGLINHIVFVYVVEKYS